MKDQKKTICRTREKRAVGDISSSFREADLDWARRTAARYRDHAHIFAELEERAKFRERERARPSRTVALWKELRNWLKAKVSAFNAQWGEEFIKCKSGRDKFSIALPPSTPEPPHDIQAEAVRVSLRYNRKQLLFHLAHSDSPESPVWALRPDLESSRGDVEICIVMEKRKVIPFTNTTPEKAAELLVECLLRLPARLPSDSAVVMIAVRWVAFLTRRRGDARRVPHSSRTLR
jgi:hypothetical protein